jgi:pyrrolidone-carboxylate peptidase
LKNTNIDVLLTGFEPFGPYAYNPVQDVAKFFDWKNLGRLQIKWVVLSSIYDAFAEIEWYINDVKPSIILGMWLASRVKGIRIEAVGNNIRHSDYVDAKWQLIKNDRIEKNWPDKIVLTTNAQELYNLLVSNNIPSEVSHDAEWFICNDIIYQTARYIQQNNLDIRQCFIHTPWTEDYLDKVDIESWKMKIRKDTLIDSVKILLLWLSKQIA